MHLLVLYVDAYINKRVVGEAWASSLTENYAPMTGSIQIYCDFVLERFHRSTWRFVFKHHLSFCNWRLSIYSFHSTVFKFIDPTVDIEHILPLKH